MPARIKIKKTRQQAEDQPADTAPAIADVQHARLDWPALHPITPSEDLSLTPLLPGHVLTISHFWTAKLCKIYVDFLTSLPLTTTPGKPKKGHAVRVNDRYQIDDPNFAEQLWNGTALKDLVEHPVIDGTALNAEEARALWGGDVLGLNSNVRVYRYREGQFFDQHYDESNLVIFPGAPAIPARTTWTFLLYLTSPATGCQGGETVFYPEAATKRHAAPAPVVAELEVGMALLHRHGKDCLLHEGREVLTGEKWVIRTDLCVRR
ncbi:hypothetical protein LTR53_014032 [Teratosphaeriaceae sp. CCFEE 6253]|nr:hypothetical protein LTR53_014032 [Teratosphaeriaceae sp. CCFEE 6253]